METAGDRHRRDRLVSCVNPAYGLPEFASVLAQARGENLPEPPAGISWQRELILLLGKWRLQIISMPQNLKRLPVSQRILALILIPVVLPLMYVGQLLNIPLKRLRR